MTETNHPKAPQDIAPGGGAGADHALLADAVREAGRIAMGYFGRAPVATRKPDGTRVSEADLAVDAALRARLTAARPDYGWLSEETADDPSRLSRRRVWIVDPIDGTSAFLDEKPEWTIAAALVEDGAPVAGVVYNPAREEFFEAIRGAGARLNGARIRVRDARLDDGASLIVTSGFLKRGDWATPWPSIETCWVNSVAYRIALVAAGRYDAMASLSKKSDWDIAAADLLIREAGGAITTHAGARFVYNAASPLHESVVAGGPALHEALIERMRRLNLR